MDKTSVDVSSVRSRFENGNSYKNGDQNSPKPSPRLKKPATQKPSDNEAKEVDGPKRATLAREIESLPKNSVMKRLQMFENEPDSIEPTSPVNKLGTPTFTTPVKLDNDAGKKVDKVRPLKTVKQESDDKARPPRPPLSYKRLSSSDAESDTPCNSPRDVKPKPLVEAPKSPKAPPNRPPPPLMKKHEKTPFTVTLVSKTCTQIPLPDKENASVASLTSMFESDSTKQVKRVKSVDNEFKKPELLTKPKLKAYDSVQLPIKKSPERPKRKEMKESPMMEKKLPPKKPPPPKPPRTFEHDAYLASKRRALSDSDSMKQTPVKFDDYSTADYEPVDVSKYRPVLGGGGYEMADYCRAESISQDNTRCPLYSPDGSYRSYGYSSIKGLQRSASDETLYAKDYSTIRLGEPLTPLYAVPNKKPCVPPKLFLDDGGYALPYCFDTDEKVGELKRSRSFKEQLGAGGPVRRPVSYRRDGKHSNVKPVVYNQVRNKVDEAYSLLTYHQLEPAEHAQNTDSESDDSDSQVDVGELQRRIQHVSAVREKTRGVYEKIRMFKDRLYPSLFQYALIIGLKTEDGACVPEIKFSFPQFSCHDEEPIPDFCFPDRNLWMPVVHYESETFSFVLTRQDGSRNYGYCRRLLPGNENGPRLPLVVCIVSPLGAHQLYTQVLDEVETRLNVSEEHAEEFLQAVYAKPLPSPGRTISVKCMNQKGIGEILSFTRASDMRLENVNLDSLFSCLSIQNVIKVFSSILLERRVLLAASKLSTLTNSIHALASLLYPLQWEHTFIPVLPPSLLEMTCAPTPYIIGVLSIHLSQMEDLCTEEVLIVDLDTDNLRSPYEDELSIIPRKLQKALSAVVKMALEETDTASHRHLLLSEAFLRLFVEAIGHYGEHITTLPDNQRQFMKESFCKSVQSKSLRMFLEWLTETHLFQLFIMEQMEMENNSLSLFDSRIMEHRENLASMPVNVWANFRQWAKKMGKAIKTNIKGQGEMKKK